MKAVQSGRVFLFPGQGSQYVGMGKAFFDAYGSVKRLFEEASDIAGRDLRSLCFDGPATTLVQTEHVQPAITVVSLATLQALRQEGFEPAAVAGHSVGEYAALCAAGALSFADAIRLVVIRGAAMKAEAERHPGNMAAVFGLAPDAIAAICDEVGGGDVQVANHNAPGQIVITGTSAAVDAAGKAAKAKGAKLIVPLKVSGPWHSRFMAGAQEPLRRALDEVDVSAPHLEILANVTASPYPADPTEIRRLLVEQLIAPVLWTQSIAALLARGHRTFLEVGPGRVLSGLIKATSPDVRVMNVQDVETLSLFRTASVSPSA